MFINNTPFFSLDSLIELSPRGQGQSREEEQPRRRRVPAQRAAQSASVVGLRGREPRADARKEK